MKTKTYSHISSKGASRTTLSSSLRSTGVRIVEAMDVGGDSAKGSRTSEKSFESLSIARMCRLHARAARIVAPMTKEEMKILSIVGN